MNSKEKASRYDALQVSIKTTIADYEKQVNDNWNEYIRLKEISPVASSFHRGKYEVCKQVVDILRRFDHEGNGSM